MDKSAARFAATVALAMYCVFSSAAAAVVGHGIDPRALAGNTSGPIETVGCYRLGETGYHWYHFCVGPYWLYPHHRRCHYGYCRFW